MILENRSCRTAASAVLMLAVLAHEAAGQAPRTDVPSEGLMLAINTALGGVSAGVGRAVSGRRILPGLVRGSIGGAVVYGGKRIVSEESVLAAWTGRQVAALGSSEVRNAVTGRPVLGEVVLPLGPARLYVRRTPTFRVAPRLDVASTVTMMVVSLREGTWLDRRESIRHGSVIYTQPNDGVGSAGSQLAGVIRVDDIPPNRIRDGRNYARVGVTTHELIHVIQFDFASIAWGEPLERRILRNVRDRPLLRYLDFGLAVPILQVLNSMSEYREEEALSLAPGS